MRDGDLNRMGSVMALLNMHHMARLFWALHMDGRVPALLKLQAWCGMIYFFSPLDVTPDFFTGVGLLDDLIMCLILLQSFIELAPRTVVSEHCMRLGIEERKVFVNVPRTVREAMDLYEWAMERFGGGGIRPNYRVSEQPGDDAADEDRRRSEPAPPPEPSEPPRYERYSAFRSEER